MNITFRAFCALLIAVAVVHLPAVWFLRGWWLEFGTVGAMAFLFAPALALLPAALMIKD